MLLALAVPVQGMASVAAVQCMALAHHQDDHGHTHDGADGHDQTSHTHADDGAKHVGEGDSNSHCGPCTACCASASIAGAVRLSIPSSASNTKYVFSQFSPLGVQPDGLDRPPLAL
jgi:ABC-type Zn2+ transport system substrate-binding protein/surface adhesin